jgi:hypothetical protein
LGVREVSDEEWESSFYRDGDPATGERIPEAEWIDPCRGGLFAIVDALLKDKEVQ